MNKKHEVGERYTRLLVVELLSHKKARCVCDCGNETVVARSALRSKRTRSCGCLRRTVAERKCDTCGKVFRPHDNKSKGLFCSKPCVRVNRWKKPVIINMHGYRFVYRPDNPHSDKSGRISEHRLVMADLMEEMPKPYEQVHHINGVTSDNSINNLMLLTRSAHYKLHHNQRRNGHALA